MPDEEEPKDSSESSNEPKEEGQPIDPKDNQAVDATEALMKKVAAILSERSVNYAIIVNDGASPRWIVSDVYWVLGVFQLIARRIEAGWDEDFFAEREEGEDEDED
jgi:hypothetical protein